MSELKPYTDLLVKDLQLESAAFDRLPVHSEPIQGLQERLHEIIAYLLEKDFGRLVQAMYRIDIPEDDFKKIIELTPPDQLSVVLTQRVLDRTIQKIAIRERYRNQS